MKNPKKFARIALAALLIAIVFVTSGTALVFAEESNAFDQLNVMDDLQSSTVNGNRFDPALYPFSGVLDLRIINVVEYCYSFKVNMQSNYALYLYVYNPRAVDIDVRSRANKVQMAVAWNADKTPSSYEKFDLQFCSKSEDKNYYNRFYKFKVIDHRDENGRYMAQRVNSDGRRYDISGIEFAAKGETSAKDYRVGGTYEFSGYSSGYGPDANAPSNLESSVVDLETITLRDLQSTYFRTQSSSLGVGHQNQLNSVYFSVADKYFKEYGALQKIKAEWYEYRTAPVYVIENQDAYNGMQPYIGRVTGDLDRSVPYLMRSEKGTTPVPGGARVEYWMTWNHETYSVVGGSSVVSLWKVPQVTYLFHTAGKKASEYTLTSETLREYMYGYNRSYNNGRVEFNGKSFSADLFSDKLDNGEVPGRKVRNVDAGDVFNIASYDSGNTGFQKLLDYGFFAPKTNDDYKNVAPIVIVDREDVVMTDAALSKKYLIALADVPKFRNQMITTPLWNNMVLFRFASRDYVSRAIDISVRDGAFPGKSHEGYYFFETVFFDFDILEFTFNKDGVYHVIPVVSDPIDIIGPGTPPIQGPKIPWALIVGIIICVIVYIIFHDLINGVIKVVFKVVTFPIRLLWNAIFKRKKKE